jgi:hypothetical protein
MVSGTHSGVGRFTTAPSALIPMFERRPFTIAGSAASENKFLDLIVRKPMDPEETETPVATVSKRYKLVQHADGFEKACEALKKASIDHDRVSGELTMSVYGSKMALTLALPKEFDFDPGDGHVLKLSFHTVNSVDGSCRLRVMLGWFRFSMRKWFGDRNSPIDTKIHPQELPDLCGILAVLRCGPLYAAQHFAALSISCRSTPRRWVSRNRRTI